MDTWVNTVSRVGLNTKIYYNRTGLKANSLMDIYYNSGLGPDEFGHVELAHTEFFVSSTRVYPWASTNWNWNRIILNTYITGFSSLSNYDRQGTLAHEMGHCFGLNHLTARERICESDIFFNKNLVNE